MKSKNIKIDKFARTLAILSLILGLVTAYMFYRLHFHAYADLKAAIIYADWRKDNINMEVAFTNSGNQYAIIKRAIIMVAGKKKVEEHPIYGNVFSYLSKFDSPYDSGNNPEFPRILKPGEMYLARLSAPFDLSNYLEKAININSEYVPNTVVIGLEIIAIDYQGKTYRATATCCHVTRSGNTIAVFEPEFIDLFNKTERPLPDDVDQIQPSLIP